MRGLNNSDCNSVAHTSVKYWQSCVFGDLYEVNENPENWLTAFEFAQKRGLDVHQLLEGWATESVN